jgi:hypothetical protein
VSAERRGVLTARLEITLEQLDATVDAIERTAAAEGIDPYAMRWSDGSHALAPVLVAQAQVLAALVALDVAP